jgi:hypothetical protein
LPNLGLGKILALVGLVVVVVLVLLVRLALLPEGVLFGLAFLAVLLL